MAKRMLYRSVAFVAVIFFAASCTLQQATKTESKIVPPSFNVSTDSASVAKVNWEDYFSDPYLAALIDTALSRNQELNITMQEIQISQNEIRARKGEYLPFLNAFAGAGGEKEGEYTRKGAVDKNLEIKP